MQVELWDFPGTEPLARLSHATKLATIAAGGGPVGALEWLPLASGLPALLVGDAANCTLRLWNLSSQGLSGAGSLHLQAAPGKVSNATSAAACCGACAVARCLSCCASEIDAWILQEAAFHVTLVEAERLVVLSGARPGAAQVLSPLSASCVWGHVQACI